MKATQWKCGMSSCCTLNLESETFEGYAKNGIDMMEISLHDYQYDGIDPVRTKKFADATGVKLWSYHLPFSPFEKNNIATKDKELLKHTVELQLENIRKAAAMEIGIAVIHPSGEPNNDIDRPELMDIASETLAELAESAAREGVTIAVEDLPRTCLGNCSSDIEKLISKNDKLKVVFDTNHLLAEKNEDFVRAVGDKIITLHVSDYDFRNERHWLPYEGDVDWVKLVTALEEVGYSGPFMYEVNFKTPENITRRDLTFEDFRKNYLACINKQKAEVIGKRSLDACLANAYYREPVIKY